MSSTSPLSDFDEQQAMMMAERCIMVDEQDNVLGPVSKYDAHRGSGILHRAFSVLLFDSSDRLLLQQRSHEKITFPGVWANSCCSHPLHVDAELEEAGQAGVMHAALRKIQQELGIDPGSFEGCEFRHLGRMHYQARANAEWVEHEMDHVLAVRADVDTDHNTNEIADVAWVDSSALQGMCEDPAFEMAPWFLAIKSLFLDAGWPSGSDSFPPTLDNIQHMGVLT